MGTEDNSKQELWQEVQEHGGAYRPRDRRRVKGVAARDSRYHSPYRRAFDAYVKTRLRGYYLHSRRRLADIKDPATKKNYIQKVREMNARLDPIRRTVWAAYKATHIVHLGNGIFWNDDIHWRSPSVDAERGRKAGDDFYDSRNRDEIRKANGLPDIQTPEQLAAALEIDIPKLRWMAYHREVATYVHYHSFTIPKKSGGTRQIWAPNRELKSKQRWILRNILDPVPIHGAAHGFVAGCSIGTNASVHVDSEVVVSIDLENFFPSFTFRRVKGVFRRIGYVEGVATLMALLCTEAPRQVVDNFKGKKVFVAMGERCLPQGSPASPAITNIACMGLDRRLAGLAKKFGWRYTRYADDLTFSYPTGQSSPNTQAFIDFVNRIVSDEGFKVHPTKTAVLKRNSRQEVTGLVVNGESEPRTPADVKRMLRAAIFNLERGQLFHPGESLQTLLGYASFVYSAEPDKGRELMNKLLALPEGAGTEAFIAGQDKE